MRWKRADAIASSSGAPPGQTVWFCGHGKADEIAPSAAFPRFGQKMRVLRPGRDERTLGEKAVFIAMAEQQFTKRNLVRIIAIGRRSGLARAIPVERWLRDAVSETEGLDVVHVGRKERRERREAGEFNARLNGFCVSRRSFQRPRQE